MARFLLALVALLALTSFAQRTEALTAQDIVSNIKLLTQKSAALQGPARSITVLSGPLILIGEGPFPQIIKGFTDIIKTAYADISEMKGMAPTPAGPDADAIFAAFREFVQVQQQLLNTLIGKAGLFNTAPFVGEPMSQVLRNLEGTVDAISYVIIDNVEARTTDFTTLSESLDGTLETAIESYNGLRYSSRKLLR